MKRSPPFADPFARSSRIAGGGASSLFNHAQRSHSAYHDALRKILGSEMATPAKLRAACVLAIFPTTAQSLLTSRTSSQLQAYPVPAVLVSQTLLHPQPPTTATSASQPNYRAANQNMLHPQLNLQPLLLAGFPIPTNLLPILQYHTPRQTSL